MPIKPKQGWFLAFTALFAVLAGFVFWGTWSLDIVPVMPDCATTFPVDNVTHWLRGWCENGKFVPGDLAVFLGSPYLWVELQYALATYCAALGLVYFLRGRGLSRPAAYGAGLSLAFSGYWLTLFSAGHLGWFQWMTYGVFAFGLIDRALTKGRLRHWLLLGACVAWASFYQPDLWLLFTVFTTVYFLFRWLMLARTGRAYFPLRWLKGSALALGAFVLIGLPSFRSAICHDMAGRDKQIEAGETLSASVTDEAEKRWLFVTNWSLPPDETLEFLWPRPEGDTSCPMTLAIGASRGNGIRPYTGRLGRPKDAPSGNYRQHSLHVGFVTCLLALFALFGRNGVRPSRAPGGDRPTVIFFAGAAVVFWLFSLGRYCEPVYRLVYALPMGDYLRAPVKWHHLTEFCLAALAGYGLDGLYRCLTDRFKLAASRARLCTVAPAVLSAILLAAQAHRYCAPHHADCDPAPIMQAPVPTNEAEGQARLLRAARAQALRPIGFAPLALLTSDPRAKDLSVLWVDQPKNRPAVRRIQEPLSRGALTLAGLSVAATLATLAFLLWGLFNRRFGQREVR